MDKVIPTTLRKRIIDENHTDIYYKDTHTGQCTSFHSQTPWPIKTAWVKALFHCANKICSSKKAFQQQIDHIKKLCQEMHTRNMYAILLSGD